MSAVDPQVLASVVTLLDELKEDWDYEAEIVPETRFVADLGLESLEIVVLSTMVQQTYGRLPFPEYFDEIGRRPVEDRDITVAELVNFISEHRQPVHQEA
jgi:acyl carrier protein